MSDALIMLICTLICMLIILAIVILTIMRLKKYKRKLDDEEFEIFMYPLRLKQEEMKLLLSKMSQSKDEFSPKKFEKEKNCENISKLQT